MIGLYDFGEEADDAAGRVELAPALPLAHGELAEEVFVDPSERIVIQRGGNFRHFFQQFLEQRPREKVVRLWQNARELRVVLLDVAHGGINLCTDVFSFGKLEQIIEPSHNRQIEDALGMVGGRFFHAATAPRRCPCLLQLGALGHEADFCKSQEDQAKNWRGVFLGLEAGIGPELVGGIPQAFFQRIAGLIFFLWSDPIHKDTPSKQRIITAIVVPNSLPVN